jgi:haloalkane dehalogenase
VTELSLPESVRAQWPYQPRFARVNGWRMHYVDEGAGDPIVLLHGNPTWGFLYRDFVGPLTKAGHRVIIPDMIGFGLSEKPTREDAHSLDGHIANLTALLRGLDLTRITPSYATTGVARPGLGLRSRTSRGCARSSS